MNQEKIKLFKKKNAVFFDRDGVLNVDYGYVHKKQDFVWIKGAIKTIKYLKELGYILIVITNQSGVSRGFYTEKEVIELHNWMNKELSKQIKIVIDDFFFATELPDEKNINSRRKPSPLMINEAIQKHNISRDNSFLVGDKDSDLWAAKNAKIKGFLFEGNDLFDSIQKILKKIKSNRSNIK